MNVGPSLSSSSPFDKRLKTKLICDTLTLTGVRAYDKNLTKTKTSNLYTKPSKLKHKAESEHITASYSRLHNKSPMKHLKLVGSDSYNGTSKARNDDFEVLSEFMEQEHR